jgi:ELWxxDGT repeat protein
MKQHHAWRGGSRCAAGNPRRSFAGQLFGGQRSGGQRSLRLESLEDRRLLAGDLALVKDIFAMPTGGAPLAPAEFVQVGDVTYFSASTPTTGRELWRSDGTAAGTHIVRDVTIGTGSSNPQLLTALGDRLYFVVQEPDHQGQQLWTTDGTAAGTHLVKAVSNGSASPPRFTLGAVGDTLYFSVSGLSGNSELWKTDSTEANTTLLKTFTDDFFDEAGPSDFAALGGRLFFAAENGGNGRELWVSDGTTAGTYVLTEIQPGSGSSSPANLTTFNGEIYFSANDGTHGAELWKTDGTAAGTVLLKELDPGSDGSTPGMFLESQGLLFFVEGENTNALWRTDGTAAGTIELDGNARALVEFEGTLYAFGSSSISRSDGTVAGTFDVATFDAPRIEDLQPVVVGDWIYFVAFDGDSNEVWQTDGTQGGTRILKNLITYSGWGSFDFELGAVGGQLLFAAQTAASGEDLWISDGTETGTVALFPGAMGTADANPRQMVEFNGAVYFFATDGSGHGLWKTDGTAAGTVLVKSGLAVPPAARLQWLVVAGERLFFATYQNGVGSQLWSSDGTTAGTQVISDLGGSLINQVDFRNVEVVDGTLYLITAGSPQRLWKSDGTAAGTTLVKTFSTNSFTFDAHSLTNVDGTLYFVAFDSVRRQEIWTTDGTTAGTVPVTDLPGSITLSSFNPIQIVKLGDAIFFSSLGDTISGGELWKWDPVNGAALVKDIWPGPFGSIFTIAGDPEMVKAGAFIYFFAATPGENEELWRTDGTEAGTVQVKGIRPGSDGSAPRDLVAVGQRVFFTADDGVNGRELWVSDGTNAGTQLVRDIRPGVGTSSPHGLVVADGKLYFTASVEGVGDELWVSDGTLAGTHLVQDLTTDAGGSNPGDVGFVQREEVIVVNGRLYASATTDAYGRELWSADVAADQRLVGDYDQDEDVDGADFLAWQRGLGSVATPPGSEEDGNDSGLVERGDLAVWRANFGAAIGGGDELVAATVAAAATGAPAQSIAGGGVDRNLAWLAGAASATRGRPAVRDSLGTRSSGALANSSIPVARPALSAANVDAACQLHATRAKTIADEDATADALDAAFAGDGTARLAWECTAKVTMSGVSSVKLL